ncbi:MAG TPA: hypothetical protein ENJ82_02670, partial [Bacteroidetes bacterium]|nr:hypothetical protein [Bacteroidota bacterium]
MNHPLFRPIALFSFLMFGLVACGPPETSPNSNPGKQVTDSTTIPGRANGGKSHPYSERENLINPNHFEFFQDFARN